MWWLLFAPWQSAACVACQHVGKPGSCYELFSNALPPHSPPLPPCSARSENPDYHLLTDANLSYSMRYSPGPGSLSAQQQQFGGPPHHGGMGPGPAALGASAPHMLHMGGMGGMGMGAGAPRAGGASVTMAVPEEKVGVVIGKQVRLDQVL